MTARLAEKQKEALAKKAEEAQMKLLEEERTREERRQVRPGCHHPEKVCAWRFNCPLPCVGVAWQDGTSKAEGCASPALHHVCLTTYSAIDVYVSEWICMHLFILSGSQLPR